MVVPILPIIMAVAALGSGVVQGISATKNAKNEAKAIREQEAEMINARAREAKKLMQQQKTSFLKSGVYFDSGTPLDVINETYNTSVDDINAIAKDSDSKVTNLMRQGRTAFFGSLLEGVANGAMGYFMSGGKGIKGASTSGADTSAAKTKFKSWYENLSGKYKGSFDTTNTGDKIV